jgi:hypothetical protein
MMRVCRAEAFVNLLQFSFRGVPDAYAQFCDMLNRNMLGGKLNSNITASAIALLSDYPDILEEYITGEQGDGSS